MKKTIKKPMGGRDLIITQDVCFVIMPFGPGFDKSFQDLYAPAIRDAGLQPIRADSVFTSAPIMEDIWRLLRRATILLADLTGRNPNVFYELGLAHGIQKPAVLVTNHIEDVPFDLRTLRLILYRPEQPGSQVRRAIARALHDTINDPTAALPLAAIQPRRAFETEYEFGGRSVSHQEFNAISQLLENVPLDEIDVALSGAIDRLSQKTHMRLAGQLRWEAQMERFASKTVVDDLKLRLATIGRNFPDTLLAEVIYAIKAGGEQIAVNTLVETGFARDLVEANIVYEVVEWAVSETNEAPH